MVEELGPVPQLSSEEMTAAMDTQEIVQFVTGLLKGLIQKDELNNVEHCLKDAGQL